MRTYPLKRPDPPKESNALFYLYLFMIAVILALAIVYLRATDEIKELEDKIELLETHCGRPNEVIRIRP